MNDDLSLLRRYADCGCENAFRSLVERHLSLVHHAALRQLAGDSHRARDASQVVFTEFAHKAPALVGRPVVLAGWLYTATRHACARIRRAEHRRRLREIKAVDASSASNPEATDAAADWTLLQPVIDEALHALSAPDREAVLLRFFEDRAYAEIGAHLALSEDAARRRVARALEKLRDRLDRLGVASTASALSLALGAQAGLAPPAGLAAGVTSVALANLAVTGGIASGLALILSTTSKATLADLRSLLI